MNTPDKFWSKVDKRGPDECWYWTGAVDAYGYGRFSLLQQRRTHRIAYMLIKGSIPDKLFICHTCDNRACCNPNHLYSGTPADNTRDMMERNRWNGNRKLTPIDRANIRAALQKQPEGLIRRLAYKYNVTRNTIRAIKREIQQD